MKTRTHLWFVAALVGGACGGPAEETTSSAPTATSAEAPSPAPSGLVEGLGRHHHPITTSNPEAQRYFDQGFSLVFGFNHEEAARSFQKAAELDPEAPMPHWGIAWAVGPNYNLDVDDRRESQAYKAMQTAQALAARASAAEREYIDAMAVRYAEDPGADRSMLARRYSDAMGELRRRHPDDLDAATLYAESLMNLNAWKLWSLDGRPAAGTLEIVEVLQSVLARDPDHLGANHYFIHTLEASPEPGRALPSAKRLETLAPAAGHLVHMPAHAYARTGDHAGAARANRAGVAADRAYLATAPPDSLYALMYYSHNLHFLADSEMMQGNLAGALTAAEELADRLAPHTQMMPMVESMIAMKVSVLLRFGRHDEVLALPQPAADHPVERAWWHFARGVAFARTGQPDRAATEQVALSRASLDVPESALFGGTGLESARTILSLAGTVLDARLAWARGSHTEAVGLWQKAVGMADGVAYDEPPVWYYPVRESLGAALLLDGRAEEAERVFREDLTRHPRNPRSLFGLHASLVAQGKVDDAVWVQRAFEASWANADTTLTVEAL